MTFRCKDKNNVIREVKWIYRKNAWIPVIVVCIYQLYPHTIPQRSIATIPDVTGLNLELENLGLIISWTNNSSYLTEVSTSTSEDEWTVNILEDQNTFVSDIQPGVTVQVRVRFTSEGRFSENYATASITCWELVNFNFYGLTQEGEPNFLGNTLYNFNFDEIFSSNKIKTFLEENSLESNYVLGSISYDSSILYRLVYRNRENYSRLEFESINVTTSVVIPIPLSYSGEYDLCNAQSMCYNSGNNTFFVYSDCGFYQLSLNGVVTRLSTNNNFLNKGLVDDNGTFSTLFNDSGTTGVYSIDTSNGDRASLRVQLSLPGWTFLDPYSLTMHNGIIYAIISANEVGGAAYNGLILITIDLGLEQISFVSTIPPDHELISSVITNEEQKLIIQNVQNKNLYFLSNSGTVGEVIVNTASCCNLEQYQSMAFNPIDRHVYHASMKVENYTDNEEVNPEDLMHFNFEKLNLDTLEITPITVSGDAYEPGVLSNTTSYINDGGGDMYDSGNFLNTNITENGFIQYTHTQQTDNNFVENADGTVENGDLYFGEGSEYFTNLYSGLFVMVARDINISSFTISGELGADGEGSTSQDTLTLNNGHSGYFKKTYGANDPSVNHLVIVPSNQNIISKINQDTNDDFQQISGLENANHIYYLLFSTTAGTEVSSDLARTIGNSFLSVISGSNTTSAILSALNSNVTQITSNIDNPHIFYDTVSGTRSQPIGRIPGLMKPHCMVYKSDNSFLVVGDNGSLYSIGSNGVATYLNNVWHLFDCSSLAFVGNRLFAGYQGVANLAELDPNTGEIINEGEDKKGPIVWVDNNTIQSIRGLAAVEDLLYIVSFDGNTTYKVAVIENLIPDGFNLLYATSIGEFKITGGIAFELFGKNQPSGSYYWSYDETTTLIEVPTEEELDIEDLEVQWNPDTSADRGYMGWENVDILEAIRQNENHWWVIIDKPVDNFQLRMRYRNPVSKWSYYEWD